LVVKPDAGGGREECGGDSGSGAVEGAGVVAFEGEQPIKKGGGVGGCAASALHGDRPHPSQRAEPRPSAARTEP
jgi:hypothetical protein